VADCIPGPNLRRLLVGLNVEGEPVWLATTEHHLVHGHHRRLLHCYCPSRRIRPENQIVGEGHTQNRSCDGGLNTQITEITIHPTNEDLVKAYVSIVFDNCFMVEEIRVMQGPTGLFLSFPTKKLRDGTQRDIAFPANAETRRIIEQAILAQYEKVVGGGDVPHSTTANKHQG
jgi:stage V sporulation protein G